MDNFLLELRDTLEKALKWSESFKKGDRNFNFDIDDELFKLSEKYDKDFRSGELQLIYNLLDFYCDAIKHGFKQIDKGYSISQAHSDIRLVIRTIENSSTLNLPSNLKDRMNGI